MLPLKQILETFIKISEIFFLKLNISANITPRVTIDIPNESWHKMQLKSVLGFIFEKLEKSSIKKIFFVFF